MTIRAIILDLSGTILNASNEVRPGAQAMISRLRNRNIEIFVASNNSTYRAELLNKFLSIDESRYLYPRKVGGKRKGSGNFVNYVCNNLGVSPNNLLYLGDTEWDFFEALKGNVIFFLAAWENPNYQYGVAVNSFHEFADIVEICFLKNALWYYSIDGVDMLGRDVIVRALLDPDIPKITGITTLLKTKGREGVTMIRGFPTVKYLSLHLLASIYLEGLYLRGFNAKPIWCMYPGHEGAYVPVLDDFITIVSRLFRERYQQGIIIRHTPAPSSSSMRVQRQIPKIDTQFQTIHLDPVMREKLRNQTVIVIDDFTTGAHGFETARNFLYNVGVSSVISIAVGKYGWSYEALNPKSGVIWDSFSPSQLRRNDFEVTRLRSTIDENALSVFL